MPKDKLSKSTDSILDFFLKKDSRARCAIETLATTNRVIIAGEVGGNFTYSNEEIDHIVRSVVKEIGYDEHHFNWEKLKCEILLHQQSEDI